MCNPVTLDELNNYIEQIFARLLQWGRASFLSLIQGRGGCPYREIHFRMRQLRAVRAFYLTRYRERERAYIIPSLSKIDPCNAQQRMHNNNVQQCSNKIYLWRKSFVTIHLFRNASLISVMKTKQTKKVSFI